MAITNGPPNLYRDFGQQPRGLEYVRKRQDELGRNTFRDRPEISRLLLDEIRYKLMCNDLPEKAVRTVQLLLDLVEKQDEHIKKVAQNDRQAIEHVFDEQKRLKERIKELANENGVLRSQFPGPDCKDCGIEMDLENHGNQDFYACGTCYDGGGCTCFQVAPCSWCEHVIDADWYLFDPDASELREKEDIFEENERLTASRLCEQGPSAAQAAKPVSKLVITCQGDWSPWEENL